MLLIFGRSRQRIFCTSRGVYTPGTETVAQSKTTNLRISRRAPAPHADFLAPLVHFWASHILLQNTLPLYMGLASSGQCTSEPKPPLRSLQAARTDFDSNYYLLLVWKRRITIFLFPLLPTGGGCGGGEEEIFGVPLLPHSHLCSYALGVFGLHGVPTRQNWLG